MSERRYDVISGRKYSAGGQEKTAWTRYGSAWAKENGSISVKLDGHSLTGDYLLVEPKPREEQGGSQQRSSGQHSGGRGEHPDPGAYTGREDEIPF